MKYIVGGYSELSAGSSDFMFETLLNRQIKPILTVLYNNPAYKFLLRLSTAEIEWIEFNHPEINMLIKDLCKKDQLELLSSSYYDSDFSLVPNHERSVHIEKTTAYLRKKFGKKPNGLWFCFQVFNPAVVPVMELSSLDYVVISTYNQSNDSVLFNKPFCMSEMGKETVVFPVNDQLSRTVIDIIKSEKADKVNYELKKVISGSSNGLNTFMLNLDLLAYNENLCDIFSKIYSIAGTGSTTPSAYLEDYSVSKYGYLPFGNYGRECPIGKSLCINQKIFESNVLSKNYFTLETLRSCIRSTKKNLECRSLLDELVLEGSSSAMYIPVFSDFSCYRRYSSKKLCEIEKLLAAQGLLPSSIDVSLNHNISEISNTKNIIAYISPKGGTINKLNYANSYFDLTLNSESGLFYDAIRSVHSSKVTNLSNKVFEISALDKRRNDFTAQCSFTDLGLSVTKKYKFKTNSLSVEYEICNISNELIKDSIFETMLNLSFDKDPKFLYEAEPVASLQYLSKDIDLDFQLSFSEDTVLTSKTVSSSINTIKGYINDYQYTQFKLQKPLTLKPAEMLSFTVIMRIDRCKEKNNDVK